MGCARAQAAGRGEPDGAGLGSGRPGAAAPLLRGAGRARELPQPPSLCAPAAGLPVTSLAPCPSGLFLHSVLRRPQPSVPCFLALLQALPFHPVFLGKRRSCHGEASAESHGGEGGGGGPERQRRESSAGGRAVGPGR